MSEHFHFESIRYKSILQAQTEAFGSDLQELQLVLGRHQQPGWLPYRTAHGTET